MQNLMCPLNYFKLGYLIIEEFLFNFIETVKLICRLFSQQKSNHFYTPFMLFHFLFIIFILFYNKHSFTIFIINLFM